MNNNYKILLISALITIFIISFFVHIDRSAFLSDDELLKINANPLGKGVYISFIYILFWCLLVISSYLYIAFFKSIKSYFSKK